MTTDTQIAPGGGPATVCPKCGTPLPITKLPEFVSWYQGGHQFTGNVRIEPCKVCPAGYSS